PAQFLLRDLSCAEPGRTHSRRNPGARARYPERNADLPFGVEWHGHDQPALHHLQQPDPRGSAGTAIRRISRRRVFPVLCRQRPADLGTGSPAMNSSMSATMSLVRNMMIASVLLTTGAWPAWAASEADYKTALAAAEAAEKEAGQLRNKWTTT